MANEMNPQQKHPQITSRNTPMQAFGQISLIVQHAHEDQEYRRQTNHCDETASGMLDERMVEGRALTSSKFEAKAKSVGLSLSVEFLLMSLRTTLFIIFSLLP